MRQHDSDPYYLGACAVALGMVAVAFAVRLCAWVLIPVSLFGVFVFIVLWNSKGERNG